MDDDEEDAAPARKVFVLNAGEYTGKVLCKRFLASEDEKFEILGTLRDAAQKPSWVKRVVDTTPEALLAAFRECELTVLDCLNAMDGSEALLEAISGVKEFEDEKVLIGISSVMTWTRTTPDAEEPEKALTEEEYKRRRPHSSFKELLALEKLVTKSKRPGLRTHVVAAGLVYGQDEDLFHDLFKTAWNCKPLTLASIGDGSNLLPTIHVSDLCSVVLKLLEADSLPYLLAVDQGQAQEEAAQTLKTVVEKLSAVLGMGGVGVMAPEQVRLQKDYEFFQVGIRLDGAAVGEMGFEWQGARRACSRTWTRWCKSTASRAACCRCGFSCTATTTSPRRRSPPRSPPSTRYRTSWRPRRSRRPRRGTTRWRRSSRRRPSRCPTRWLPRRSPPPSRRRLARTRATSCRASPSSSSRRRRSSARAGGGEGEEEEAAEEAEEGAEKPAAAPELVLVLEAEDAVVKAKLLAQPSLATTEEEATAKLAAYATHNAEDSPTSVLALKALAGVEPLHFAVEADTGIMAMAAKARVYLGAPRNYGPTEEELASKAAVEEAPARNWLGGGAKMCVP